MEEDYEKTYPFPAASGGGDGPAAARDPNRFTDLYDNAAVRSVESLRLMGYYESCAPSPTETASIRVLGGVNDGAGFSSLQRLTELKEVPNTAWSGQGAVTVDGRSYSIPISVMAYNRDTRTWIEPTADKSAVEIAHAYAKQCNLYASSDGVVRIIEVGGDFR